MIDSQQQDFKKQNEQLVSLPVIEVIQEAEEVRTFRLDNLAEQLAPHKPGMFVKICLNINGAKVWRSFSISSSPLHPERIDLTIKRNPLGQVGNYFFDHIGPGSNILVKGPLGKFYFDPQEHTEPLVLLCAGIGITPMISMVRYLKEAELNNPCYLFYGARTHNDIIFDEETRSLITELPDFHYFLTLSQPAPHWLGYCGYLNSDFVLSKIPQVQMSRFFLCGPRRFNQDFEISLLENGVPHEMIHSEQFHKNRKPK
ncbi:Ferredoxin--NAD(P)(+) reductase (naphthalene dioxygenase/salicylate 5-hydroxylase ferredoxin-specific) [Gimesia alba]|uniref:Ferredoxin--NAD(P)(+) reductase (Naphthalene dioxygenase/salicylate 5-hydroxylase ferredoxin-specific) n=1 Tax=Gimesia alba TaxID=2527973 RepID=A0A517RG89_9PLAN|nr:ferredoxin reductase [Gimesia alba]QDT42893.1 Ferredoxin--NAD(P)(+) reductase (naphthalene dioxygenase/salicylate 5-hydroxylase ferredoxin-specific) [Gimesia alba]